MEEVVKQHEETIAANQTAVTVHEAEVDDLQRMIRQEQETVANLTAQVVSLNEAAVEYEEKTANLESQMEALQVRCFFCFNASHPHIMD
jgi:septal ring factor EnvC (AmiA/AmiB activator)